MLNYLQKGVIHNRCCLNWGKEVSTHKENIVHKSNDKRGEVKIQKQHRLWMTPTLLLYDLHQYTYLI